MTVAAMRAAPMAVLLAAAVLAAIGGAGASPSTSPAFLWAQRPYFTHADGSNTRVSYEVLSPQSLSSTFLGSVVHPSGSGETAERYLDLVEVTGDRPDVFVAFLGSQLRTGDLAKLSGLGALKPLEDAVGTANSSVIFPYVLAGEAPLPVALLQALTVAPGNVGRLAVAASCSADAVKAASVMAGAEVWAGHELEAHALENFLDSQSGIPDGRMTVLLLCSSATSLAGEMRELGAVTAALQRSSAAGIVMYASEHDGGAGGGAVGGPAAARRSMKEGDYGADYDCSPGTVCRTQVYVLESVIVAVVCLFALLSGLCCMSVLEGPSKFEVAEAGQQ